MGVKNLRAFNSLAEKHIGQFGTREDFKILLEIAVHQQEGNFLTLKQLVLCAAIPESTLKRRLGKLVHKKFVYKQLTPGDRRTHGYGLPEPTIRTLHTLIEDLRSYPWD